MHILVAPDKLKGSLSSVEICEIVSAVLSLSDGAHVISCPIADGGDGFMETMRAALNGRLVSLSVQGPLGLTVRAEYAVAGNVAIIEMAKASGIALVQAAARDPWRASTFGTGELMRHAIENGAEKLLLGIGGSATNDGGVGMAMALGFQFLNAAGQAVSDLPDRLMEVTSIVAPDQSGWPEIEVACDVENPLLGPNGCTRIYGPQKGVVEADLARHEERLQHLVRLTGRGSMADIPGSGAAGGLGFGLMTFANAKLSPGFSLVSEALDLEAKVRAADVVITAEGRLDASTLMGKAPASLAALCNRFGKPLIAFCGSVDETARPDLEILFREILPISPEGMPLEEAIKQAPNLLQKTVQTWFATFCPHV